MKERILDVIKWGLILMIAGGIFHFSTIKNQYTIVGVGRGAAYKMQNRTGKIWFITPNSEELISSGTDYEKNQSLLGTEKSKDKSKPLDLGPHLKKKSVLEQAEEEYEKEHQKNNE